MLSDCLPLFVEWMSIKKHTMFIHDCNQKLELLPLLSPSAEDNINSVGVLCLKP